jgi:hypothetical protein
MSKVPAIEFIQSFLCGYPDKTVIVLQDRMDRIVRKTLLG